VNCRRIRKKLPEYIDGTLSIRDTRLVEDHIAECDSCCQEIEIFNKLSVSIHRIDYPPDSVWRNFLSDLHDRIDKEIANNFAEEHKLQTYIVWGWTIAAVAAVMFLVTSILLGYRLDNAKNHYMPQPRVASESPIAENSESYIIAKIVSKALIDDKRVAELKKLQRINEYSIFAPLPQDYYSIFPETSAQPKPDSEESKEFPQPPLYDSFLNFGYMDSAEYYASESGSI
jgi:hypothetical protein